MTAREATGPKRLTLTTLHAPPFRLWESSNRATPEPPVSLPVHATYQGAAIPANAPPIRGRLVTADAVGAAWSPLSAPVPSSRMLLAVWFCHVGTTPPMTSDDVGVLAAWRPAIAGDAFVVRAAIL